MPILSPLCFTQTIMSIYSSGVSPLLVLATKIEASLVWHTFTSQVNYMCVLSGSVVSDSLQLHGL